MSNVTFREAVQEFEDAIRDLLHASNGNELAVYTTAKQRLLAFDPDGESAAEDRYADEHAGEIDALNPDMPSMAAAGVPVQPEGISPHSMIESEPPVVGKGLPMSALGKFIFDSANDMNRAYLAGMRNAGREA